MHVDPIAKVQAQPKRALVINAISTHLQVGQSASMFVPQAQAFFTVRAQCSHDKGKRCKSVTNSCTGGPSGDAGSNLDSSLPYNAYCHQPSLSTMVGGIYTTATMGTNLSFVLLIIQLLCRHIISWRMMVPHKTRGHFHHIHFQLFFWSSHFLSHQQEFQLQI